MPGPYGGQGQQEGVIQEYPIDQTMDALIACAYQPWCKAITKAFETSSVDRQEPVLVWRLCLTDLQYAYIPEIDEYTGYHFG